MSNNTVTPNIKVTPTWSAFTSPRVNTCTCNTYSIADDIAKSWHITEIADDNRSFTVENTITRQVFKFTRED